MRHNEAKTPEEKVVGDGLKLLVHLEGDHDHDVSDDSDEGEEAEHNGETDFAEGARAFLGLCKKKNEFN